MRFIQVITLFNLSVSILVEYQIAIYIGSSVYDL